MVRSTATSVDDYIRALPEDRRHVITEMRSLVRRSLPEGYEESVSFGMLSYAIPLERYPDTYNGQPLGYVALASQKNHCALYLMATSMDPSQLAALKEAFARAGKKLDMGKSCLRFRRVEDLALDAVAQAIAAVPPEQLIAMYEASRQGRSPAGTRS